MCGSGLEALPPEGPSLPRPMPCRDWGFSRDCPAVRPASSPFLRVIRYEEGPHWVALWAWILEATWVVTGFGGLALRGVYPALWSGANQFLSPFIPCGVSSSHWPSS